jgi:putative flippase GtrA
MYLTKIISKNISEDNFIQIFRFILIGGFTAMLDFITLFALTDFFNINYLLSAGVGFILGSSINYWLSIKWVFTRGKFNNYASEFSVFILFTFLGLLLNQLIMYICTGLLLWLYLYSKMVAIIIVTIFNYLTKKYIVFLK